MNIRHTLTTLVTVLALGCTTTTVDHRPVPQAQHVTELPVAGPRALMPRVETSMLIRGDTWEIKLPPSWDVVKRGTTKDDITYELVATTKELVGRTPLIMSVNSIPWTANDGDATMFVVSVVMNAEQSEGMTVINAVVSETDTGPASFALLRKGPFVLVQAAFTHGIKGYVIRCGGDALMTDPVMTSCKVIVGSFRLLDRI